MLTQSQKAYIKYILAFFSFSHLKSFLYSNKYQFTVKELFKILRPELIRNGLVRVGGNLDGSYLVPDLSFEYEGVISPGVGQTFDFESAIVGSDRLVVLIDGTVDRPANLPTNFIFLKKMLGSSAGARDSYVSLEDVTREYFSKSKSLVLQMDIEGGEYEVLNSIEEDALTPFALVLVEFHHFHQINTNSEWNNSIESALQLLRKDFTLVHTHPNNAGGFFLWKFRKIPKVVETTWIKNDLVESTLSRASLPHPLDQPNDLLMQDLKFPNF